MALTSYNMINKQAIEVGLFRNINALFASARAERRTPRQTLTPTVDI
jgi:hypothetical protein